MSVEHPPPFPQGNTAFKRWAQWVHRTLLRLETNPSPGAVVQRTTRGSHVIPRLPPRAAGAAGPGQRFRVKSVQGDYLTCRTWDGTTEGGSDVLVAKLPDLRHSLTSQTIDGVAVTYSGHSITGGKCMRTASATGYLDQTEWVLPVYQLGTGPDSEIWAEQPMGGTGVAAAPEWIHADNRAWCQV